MLSGAIDMCEMKQEKQHQFLKNLEKSLSEKNAHNSWALRDCLSNRDEIIA